MEKLKRQARIFPVVTGIVIFNPVITDVPGISYLGDQGSEQTGAATFYSDTAEYFTVQPDMPPAYGSDPSIETRVTGDPQGKK